MDLAVFSSLKENVSHGTLLWPFNRYHMRIPESYRDLPAHWHEEIEFTLIREGRLSYYVDMEPLDIEAGDLLIISPNTLHSAHEIPGRETVSDSIVFHPDMLGAGNRDACTIRYLEPVIQNRIRFRTVCRSGDPAYPELLGCFNDLWTLSEEKPFGHEIEMKEKLFRFLSVLFRFRCYTETGTDAASPSYEAKIKQVLSFIQHNYAENITVRQLADICRYSQVHFMNLFRKSIGCTAVEYINSYRLSAAAANLESTDRAVMDIALETGFHNISYFNRMFLQKFHMTPREYRRTHREARPGNPNNIVTNP